MSKELEALKRAKMEHSIIKQGFPEQEYIYLLTNISKKLKSLEIIKDMFEVWEDNGTYHIRPLYDIMKIKKEEYDLLKEVLLCGL